MDNLAEQLDSGMVVQQVGTVVGVQRADLSVQTASGRYRAARAVSCLVEPEEGDRVLSAVETSGRCWVLAVLSRDAGAGAALSVDSDLAIRARAGKVSLAASDGVDITSTGAISLVSGVLKVNALRGSMALERLTFVGKLLQSEIEKVKSFASTFDAVLGRLSQRVGRSYRTVEETDQLRAGRIDYVAKKNLSMRGEHAIVNAQKLVKIDGEQIHVG